MPSPETQRERVPQSLHRERLDVVLAALFAEVSRRGARKLIGAGAVFVNGQRVRVNGRLVDAGAELTVQELPSGAKTFTPQLLHVDDELIVVCKPSGVPTEPTRQAATGSLADALRRHLRLSSRAFLAAAHRLDHQTSGLVVFARNPGAARWLGEAFAAREVRRIYLALVDGAPRFQQEWFDARLGRRKVKGRVPIDPGGRPAQTSATVMARGAGTAAGTLLWVEPITGRLQQIRAHLASAGHPVCQDRAYGAQARSGAPRAAFGLHAAALHLPAPEGHRVFFAPAPEGFRQLMLGAGLTTRVLSAVQPHFQRPGLVPAEVRA